MTTIRELITRYVFKADTAAVDKFGRAVDGAKEKMGRFVDTAGRLREKNGRYVGGGGGGLINSIMGKRRDWDGAVNMIRESVNSVAGFGARAAIGLTAGGFGLGAIFKQMSDFEQTEVAFETMLGSAEKARKVLGELQQFAAATPFGFKDVAELSKRLLAFNFAAEELIPTMNALGNIAAGVGKEKLPQLILALGQVRAATKLRGSELRQFTEAGVPLISELAKQLGKPEAAIQGMVEAGQIGYEEVRKSIFALSQEGGRFNNLMQRQSKTLGGMASNLVDQLQMLVIDLGKRGLLKEAKAYLSSIVSLLAMHRVEIIDRLDFAVRLALKSMRGLIRIAQAAGRIFQGLARFVGGTENAITLLYSALMFLTGVFLLGQLGKFTIGIWGAFRALLALQGLAFAIPIAIGLAVAAIAIIAEDIYGYFQGKKSITGLLLGGSDKMMSKLTEKARKLGEELKQGAKGLAQNFATFFKENGPQIATMIQEWVNLALIVSGLAIEIGKAIAQGIWEGIVRSMFGLKDGDKVHPVAGAGNAVSKDASFLDRAVGAAAAGESILPIMIDAFKGMLSGDILGIPANARALNDARLTAPSGPSATPGAAGAGTQINVTSPISVTVPPSTPPEKTSAAIREGFGDALTAEIRRAHRATASAVTG